MARRILAVFLLAACGGHGETPPPPDMFEPPPPPPPPVGDVVVTVLKDGAPVAGVRVFFQDALERPVAAVVTDATGFARATVEQGAIVTAIDPFGPKDGATDVRTWLNVPVNENLILTETTATPINVTFTAPLDASIARYEVRTSCGGGPLAKLANIARGQVQLAGCKNATADVLVIGFDAGDVPRLSFANTGVLVADGATIALSANYEAISSTAITWSGIEGTSLDATTTLQSARGDVFSTAYTVPVSSGVGNHDAPLPNLLDSQMVTETRPQPTDFGAGLLRVVDWQPLPQSQQFIGLFSGELLPELLSPPQLSPPRDVFWSEAAFVAVMLESAPPPPELFADVVVVAVKATRGAQTWRWTIATPHVGSVARFPLLPLDVSELNLAVGDTVEIVDFWQAKVPGGYDTVRSRIHDVRRPQDLIAQPFGGRLVVQEVRK